MTHILVADDSITIQKVVELTFMDVPRVQITSVGNGDDACTLIERIRPDIVIADVHMPGRSGFQVASFTKALRTETPVLILVGAFEFFDEDAFGACGADAALEKPFDSHELTRLVVSLLSGQQPQPSLVFSPGRILRTTRRRGTGAPRPECLRVFLCHASQDKAKVRELGERLRRSGFESWLDEDQLLPGQRWELELTKALREAHAVLVCLSEHSVTKRGYVQKEIAFALDLLAQQPEGSIFLIPVKLEECEIPERLSQLQVARLFQGNGFPKLIAALNLRAKELGLSPAKEPD